MHPKDMLYDEQNIDTSDNTGDRSHRSLHKLLTKRLILPVRSGKKYVVR